MTYCQRLAYPKNKNLTVRQHRALNYRNKPNTPLNKELAIAPQGAIGSLESLKSNGAQSDDGSRPSCPSNW
jgi:hypothetical protein